MCGCINMGALLVFRPPSPDSATSKINSWWQTWHRHYYYYYYIGTYLLVSVAETVFLSSPNPFVCVYLWWCLCLRSTVSGVACVAERAGPDCHCSNRNWENLGLPAPWIHSYGRTAYVSTGCFQRSTYHQKDECLLKLGHQCSKNMQLLLLFFLNGTFWPKEKVERVFYAQTKEHLHLPQCTCAVALVHKATATAFQLQLARH